MTWASSMPSSAARTVLSPRTPLWLRARQRRGGRDPTKLALLGGDVDRTEELARATAFAAKA
jgi:hypothetical protein